VTIERARELISPTIAVLETHDGVDGTIARIGGDADWIARYLASLACDFEVLEGNEVKDELRALAAKILGGLPPSLDPSWPGSAAPGGSPPSHE
jgi:predicted DNA-binding transcriptional regulator YafY